MKRYLNVGQPPAPAGRVRASIPALPLTLTRLLTAAATLLLCSSGMASDPNGNNPEPNFYPNFTKDVFAAESNPYYAAFVEDTYHFSKTLTVTAGLRWDIFGGRNERFNRQEYFNPNVSNTLNGVTYRGAEIYANGTDVLRYNDQSSTIFWYHAWALPGSPSPTSLTRRAGQFDDGPTTHNVASAGLNTDGFSSSDHVTPPALTPTAIRYSIGLRRATRIPEAALDNIHRPIFFKQSPFPTEPPQFSRLHPPAWLITSGTTLNTVLRSQRTPTTYNYNFAIEMSCPIRSS